MLKLGRYRATLRLLLHKRRKVRVFVWKGIRKTYHFLLFLSIHNKSTTTTPKCTLPQRLVIKELKPILSKQCNSLRENSLFISVLISLIITSLFTFLKMYKYFITYRWNILSHFVVHCILTLLTVCNIYLCQFLYFHFGGARKKGFAWLRNVLKLLFWDEIGHAKPLVFRL